MGQCSNQIWFVGMHVIVYMCCFYQSFIERKHVSFWKMQERLILRLARGQHYVIVLEECHFFDVIIIQLLVGFHEKSKGGALIVTFILTHIPRGGVGCQWGVVGVFFFFLVFY
jgi:hypothetical protein